MGRTWIRWTCLPLVLAVFLGISEADVAAGAPTERVVGSLRPDALKDGLGSVVCISPARCVAIGAQTVGTKVGSIAATTSDGGRTWAQTSADPDPHTLRIHPTQPNRVYEGGGVSYCDSRDGGASWRRDLEGIPDEIRYFYSLAVDSGDPANVLLSGSRDPFSGHAVIPEMPVWSSLYRHKLDLGFEEITDGLPPRDETAMGTLAAGDAGEFVYVTEPGDIYRSTDGGRSFATVPYAARAARGSIARAVSFSPR